MKSTHFTNAFIALSLAFWGAATSANAVLVSQGFVANSSFENGLSGWTLDQASVRQSYTHTNKIGTFGAFTATNGSSFAVLNALNRQSSVTAPASLQQVVTLGQVFSFDWNYLGQDYRPYNDPFVVSVSSMGTVLDVGIVSLGDFAVTGWRTTSIDTTAFFGQTATISFMLTNMSDATNPPMALVDNIFIGPVPEPTTALYGLGLVGAGLAAMRRRARAAAKAV